jgi:hypothetical protein
MTTTVTPALPGHPARLAVVLDTLDGEAISDG